MRRSLRAIFLLLLVLLTSQGLSCTMFVIKEGVKEVKKLEKEEKEKKKAREERKEREDRHRELQKQLGPARRIEPTEKENATDESGGESSGP